MPPAEAGRTCRPMHRLYLPPLDETPVLAIDEVAQEFWGRDWLDVSNDSGLRIPYAREDDPFDHSQKLLSVDLSGSMGNAALVSSPTRRDLGDPESREEVPGSTWRRCRRPLRRGWLSC